MPTKRKTTAKPMAVAGVNERPVDGVSPQVIAQTAERTVNGIPISKLPLAVQGLIGYEMTDQGIAEKNAKRVDSKGRAHSGIEVLVNEGFDQQILQRSKAEEPWETADPLLDAKNAYAVPGFRYRGLGPAVIRKKGMRGWEVQLDSKGDPVKVGNMYLARMPIERAERRNKKFRDDGNTNAAEAAGRFTVDHERAAHDSKSEGIRVLHAGETLRDDADPDRPISIGVHSHRGERADAAA